MNLICPVVINNRNRLTTTKNMVEHLVRLNPKQKVIILDNDSTYTPLLEWYKTLGGNVSVQMHPNHGHLAFWTVGLDKTIGSYFVYTDSDIVLNVDMPADWADWMFNIHLSYGINKIALALRIDNLPEHYRYKNQVIRNEGRWWLPKNQIAENIYLADTDTTFAMYKNIHDNQYQSLRLAHPNLIAEHKPWYDDIYNLDAEEQFYLDNLGERQLTQYSKQAKHPNQYTDI
jgi:glycosyltransferase involved in cell wall biosynthesis